MKVEVESWRARRDGKWPAAGQGACAATPLTLCSSTPWPTPASTHLVPPLRVFFRLCKPFPLAVCQQLVGEVAQQHAQRTQRSLVLFIPA